MITYSEILNTDLQIDGRSWVTESHISDSGEEFRFTYMANAGDDLALNLSQRAQSLNG